MHTTSRHLASQDQWFAGADERHDLGVATAARATIISTPCASRPAAAPAPRCRRMRHAGFTLIEMMVATAIAGALSSMAYPSFQGQIQKARRADVMVSMMTLQLAEERWRTNNSSYGSLAQIGAPATSPSGHYSLQVSAMSGDGYQVLATASGAQANDTACRFMKLNVDGAMVAYSSGPDSSVTNAAAANRKCWNQ